MSKANLTIMGLERYQQHFNKSLFSGVVFPGDIDKESAINEILLECGEFEVLYSDADFLTEAITLWSKNRYYTFSKWLEALEASFSPIENYDRYDEYTDTEGTTFNGGVKNSGTVEGQVSAFDSSTYQPKDKDITSNNTTSNNKSTRELKHELHSHGNIGVMKASDMVKDYIDLYAGKNIYQLIANDFVTKFTIMVY